MTKIVLNDKARVPDIGRQRNLSYFQGKKNQGERPILHAQLNVNVFKGKIWLKSFFALTLLQQRGTSTEPWAFRSVCRETIECFFVPSG